MSAMFRALENPNYRIWASGAIVSNIGTWMQRVAQDWLVLTVLTDHSGAAVGLTTGLQFLPMLLFGPYGGVLADRYRKRIILMWTQLAMAFTGLAIGLLVVTGTAQLWHAYVAAFCLGVASAVDAPARQAFVSELVGQENISNAVALNSASFNTARLTGPAIAGVLIAWVGTGPVFLLNAASFAAVLVSLFRIRVSQPATPAKGDRNKHQVAEGVRYVRRRPDLMLIMVLVGILGAFGMNFPVINSLMATTEFRMGPSEFGLLGSIMAVGTLAGALLAARRSRPRLRFLLGGALGLGIFTILGSVAPSFWVYAIILIPVGLASITFLNSCNTSIQLSVEPEFRGRVLALYLAILQGGTALGSPLVGWIGSQFGARWSVACGGVVVLLAGMAAVFAVTRRNRLTLLGALRMALGRREPAV
ncbi:MFS family permease [Arthrobacter sp. B2I5]|uniref:MFS transporter n=1 Tax=Arthrobacter sp. B2I5 TaxID=3042266 RepID=UPI0027802410|nr:MFS transporter [Arthrobacter sp. B2I5]MDQ0826997.1 MFS family permease [Arthrobacter sp. B2I5]